MQGSTLWETLILIQMIGAMTSPISLPSCARGRLSLEKLIHAYGEKRKQLIYQLFMNLEKYHYATS